LCACAAPVPLYQQHIQLRNQHTLTVSSLLLGLRNQCSFLLCRSNCRIHLELATPTCCTSNVSNPTSTTISCSPSATLPSLHGLSLESTGASKNTLEANLLVRANLLMDFPFGTLAQEIKHQKPHPGTSLEQVVLLATVTHLVLAIPALAEDICLLAAMYSDFYATHGWQQPF
jgi:hypothetical protein